MNRSDIASSTRQLYLDIVDAVAGRVKPEFATEGVDESVLDELRALWGEKLEAALGVTTAVGQQVIQQQLPGSAVMAVAGHLPMTVQQRQLQQQQQQLYARAIQQQQQQQLRAYQLGVQGRVPVGMPPMMAPSALQQAQQAQAQAAPPTALAQLAVLQRATAQAQSQTQAAGTTEHKRKLEPGQLPVQAREAKLRNIPQADGPADDAGSQGRDEALPEEAAASAREAGQDEDDDPLTEDDEASGDEVDESAVPNVVLGQFEKVQRSKSKWKVVLKDCILTLNGKDYMVRRCTGEMDF